MHIKLLTIALCISSSFASSEEQLKDAPIKGFGNKRYYFDPTKQMGFFAAQTDCASRNLQLVTIRSETEYSVLNEFIWNSGLTVPVNIWIAATDLGVEGTFRWLTNGKKVDLKQWGPGQPDNDGGNANCLALNYQLNQRILMYDVHCETDAHFICEEKPYTCNYPCKK